MLRTVHISRVGDVCRLRSHGGLLGVRAADARQAFSDHPRLFDHGTQWDRVGTARSGPRIQHRRARPLRRGREHAELLFPRRQIQPAGSSHGKSGDQRRQSKLWPGSRPGLAHAQLQGPLREAADPASSPAENCNAWAASQRVLPGSGQAAPRIAGRRFLARP